MRFLALSFLLITSASAAQEVSHSPALVGRVTEADTGKPVVGARVQVRDAHALTDSTGVYILRDLPVGVLPVSYWSANVSAPEFRLRSHYEVNVRIAAHGISRFDVALERLRECDLPEIEGERGALYGRISWGDEVLRGANAFLPESQRGAAADLDGCYVLSGVPEGEHIVRFSSAGFEEATTQVRVRNGEAVRADAALEPVTCWHCDMVVYEHPLIDTSPYRSVQLWRGSKDQTALESLFFGPR